MKTCDRWWYYSCGCRRSCTGFRRLAPHHRGRAALRIHAVAFVEVVCLSRATWSVGAGLLALVRPFSDLVHLATASGWPSGFTSTIFPCRGLVAAVRWRCANCVCCVWSFAPRADQNALLTTAYSDADLHLDERAWTPVLVWSASGVGFTRCTALPSASMSVWWRCSSPAGAALVVDARSSGVVVAWSPWRSCGAWVNEASAGGWWQELCVSRPVRGPLLPVPGLLRRPYLLACSGAGFGWCFRAGEDPRAAISGVDETGVRRGVSLLGAARSRQPLTARPM